GTGRARQRDHARRSGADRPRRRRRGADAPRTDRSAKGADRIPALLRRIERRRNRGRAGSVTGDGQERLGLCEGLAVPRARTTRTAITRWPAVTIPAAE